LVAWCFVAASLSGAPARAQDVQSLNASNHGVAKIESWDANGRYEKGTGFVVRVESQTVYIVTAAHVVAGSARLQLTFFGRPLDAVPGEVVRMDAKLDLALLRVRGQAPAGTRALTLSASDTVSQGESVSTVGFPQVSTDWAFSRLDVSGKDGSTLSLSGGSVGRGNSGGPVLQNGGKVAAMITEVQAAGFATALPAPLVRYTLGNWNLPLDDSSGVDVQKPSEMRAGTVFRDRDCDACPEMVVIPAGSFQMGSLSTEEGRYDDEGLVHRVQIRAPFAVGRAEVTRGEFRKFVAASGHKVNKGCYYWNGKWELDASRSWESPGFPQDDTHPVVCVSYEDVEAYVAWLGRQAGKPYRLLSEAEWEYMARAGTETSRFWGDRSVDACTYANVADQTSKRRYNWSSIHDCDDGYAETSPVRSFRPNGFGVFDVIGNALEWNSDCWNAKYDGAPKDGLSWQSGDCSRRVVRGGSWGNLPRDSRSANRDYFDTTFRFSLLGFRVARTLP
jgi:formylglycine-generating enzyme required for sulfatase activity